MVKEKLYAYTYNLERSKQIKQQLADLWSNCGLSGISYDSPRLSESYKFNSMTENSALMYETTYDRLMTELKKVTEQLKLIDEAMKDLDEMDKQLIELRYFSNMRWFDVSSAMGQSEAYTRNKLNPRVLKTMVAKLAEM